MRTFSVRLPDELAAEIEEGARRRRTSTAAVNFERLRLATRSRRSRSKRIHAVANLVGSVDGLPADLSARKKAFLGSTGYGQKRPR